MRVTRDADETHALAAAVAEVTEPGDLIVLVGGLGAGKTRFVQGFADAMGVAGPATSPTFALVHVYDGRVAVVHADLYRLTSEHEVLDLGLDEARGNGAVVLVEWGDIAGDLLGPDRLTVTLAHVDDTTRSFAFDGWPDRAEALDLKTQRWTP
ncbi:MAG: tRNA threonylcarbamoyladenosine biosynthesis protein TsaE [Actinomycetota bacterium]|jgi:tRNA threonylcarbamoyladenosine biosynthesis protein TsaE